MGQTYNITMKHFNGVDYDTLLPASAKIEKVDYAGNGQYGVSTPTSVTFYTAPQLVLLPNRGFPNNERYLWRDGANQGFTPVDMIPLEYRAVGGISSSSELYLKKSADGKTFYWYGNSADLQSNMANRTFSCFGISGLLTEDVSNKNEWLIVTNRNFVVPKTGRYYLELHGGGGGAASYVKAYGRITIASGGASGKSYAEINLTANQNINVVIGKKGKSKVVSVSTSGSFPTGGIEATDGESTSFGEYTVSGGKGAKCLTEVEGTIGESVGDLASTGSAYSGTTPPSSTPYTNKASGGGVLSSYGYGDGAYFNSAYESAEEPKSGAVYLKYLGE